MTRICVIAGEPSGDAIGARLVSALKTQCPDGTFTGVGGYQMRGAGVESIFSYEQLAVMGIAEVAPKLPTILARIRQTIEHIVETKPDIVVTIDAPDFCFRVIKAVKKRMGAGAPKCIHVVAPTVWAWREGRAAKVAKFLDGMVCLFDFEPPYFERHGLRSVAVGHPMVESGALTASGNAFRDEYGIGHKETILGVLFGSRHGEFRRTGRILKEAAFKLAATSPKPPQIVAPTLPHLYNDVMKVLRDYPGAVHIVTEADQKWNAFKAMEAAMAVSGTVGLELAMLGVPHVIAYRANPMSAAIARRLIKVKYAHLANIMADRAVVPEFLQENCKADDIAAAVAKLLADPLPQRMAFTGIAARIGAGQMETPSEKAAGFVLSFISPSLREG